MIQKDRMFYRFSLYGFLKNLRFFEPFIILIFRSNGMSFLQIGLLYSVRDLTNNLMEIPTGVFADTFGRRRSMVMAFSAYLISFVIFYAFDEFYLYALAMVLFGLGEAFRSGTHKALILEYLKLNHMLADKVAYYGQTRGASQFGSAINALAAAALLFYIGDYRMMFLLTCLPYVLDLINLATYPKYLDGELAKIKRGAVWQQIKATFTDFAGIFTNPGAMRAIFNSAGFLALFKSTKDYLQPILESFALALPFLLALEDVKRSGVVVGVVYFLIYLLTSYASRSADRFSRCFKNLAQPLNLTFVLGVVLLFLAGLANWQSLILLSILIFIFFYILENLRKPITVAFISDQISQKVMASGLSVEAQLTTILVAIFAPLLGALADWAGIGPALAVFGLGTLFLYNFARVGDRRTS